jgi:hypothetical protein
VQPEPIYLHGTTPTSYCHLPDDAAAAAAARHRKDDEMIKSGGVMLTNNYWSIGGITFNCRDEVAEDALSQE